MCLWVTAGKCKIRTKFPPDLSVHCFYSEQTSLERELMHSYYLKRKAIQNPFLYWGSVQCIADNQASKWKLNALISNIQRKTGHMPSLYSQLTYYLFVKGLVKENNRHFKSGTLVTNKPRTDLCLMSQNVYLPYG